MDKFDTEIKAVKGVRVALYSLMEAVEELRRGTKTAGREFSLAITKMQEARHWLGEVLAVLGNATPYPEADKPENAIVSPTADVSEVEK